MKGRTAAMTVAVLLVGAAPANSCSSHRDPTARPDRATDAATSSRRLLEAARASVEPVGKVRVLLNGVAIDDAASRRGLQIPLTEVGARLDSILEALRNVPPDTAGASDLSAAIDTYRRLIATLTGPATGANPLAARAHLDALERQWSGAISVVEQSTGTSILPNRSEPDPSAPR